MFCGGIGFVVLYLIDSIMYLFDISCIFLFKLLVSLIFSKCSISTKEGVCYLSVIRDLYDNSIVAYQMSKDMTVKLVLDTIKKAMKKENVTAELQLHSDQGSQYVSHDYFVTTQSYGITPSMSRRGNPYDNALAENFFSILKTECIHRVKLSGYDEARLIISEYINFYNNYRIQTKTKLTPLEKRNQFVA